MPKVFHIFLIFNVFVFNVFAGFDQLPKEIVLEIFKFFVCDLSYDMKEFKENYKKLRLLNKPFKNFVDDNLDKKYLMNSFEDYVESFIERDMANYNSFGMRDQKQHEAFLAANYGSKKYFENLDLNFSGTYSGTHLTNSSQAQFIISFLMNKEIKNGIGAPLICAISKHPDLAIFIMNKFLIKNLKYFKRGEIERLSLAVNSSQNQDLKNFFKNII